MEGIITWILEWIRPWSDITKGLFFGLVLSLVVNRALWRRGEETRRALKASRDAHEADLREQIKMHAAHAEYFQRFAEGFQMGSTRLKPYANRETPPG